MDGRTLRGKRIREQIKAQIIAAHTDLMREGIPLPTTVEVARRAGLSLRVLFKHFHDANSLRKAVIQQLLTESQRMMAQPIDYSLPLGARFLAFVERHTRMLEAMTPFRRAGCVLEYSMPLVAASLRRARRDTIGAIAEVVTPEIYRLLPAKRKELIAALHTVCCWPSWENLRVVHRFSQAAARQVMAQSAMALLREAFAARSTELALGSSLAPADPNRQ
ncbi:MAG TPA: TetR/AcrR family transcriptional regulator [Candidatus Binataceae bacterium]|nr:TetR/AcrR family transcriptional regulator [Candidatus Binataceae bacterium]